jgi:hypothetical protein
MWAIAAAGEDPAGDAWKYEGRDGASPLDRLRAFQNESGAFRWQDAVVGDNMLATVQAPIAIELKTLPFAYMDVGEAAAETAAPVATATVTTVTEATTPEPTATEAEAALPETGGTAWHAALALLAAGLVLFGMGKALEALRVRGR